MWWNKPAAAAKRAFVADDGALRAIWRFLITVLAWYCASTLIALGLSRALAALFDSWGVTYANLQLAPAWVRYIAMYQTQLLSAAASTAAAVAGALLMRRRPRRPLRSLAGFVVGIAAAALTALIFLLTDSMRLVSRQPAWSADVPIMLAICFLTALGECMLALGFMRESIAKRGGRLAGCAAAIALFFIMDGGYLRNVPGMINTILLAATLCHIAEKLGVSACVFLYTGWLWAGASLAGFPGSSDALFTLYPVSENWLTGGDSGIISGLAVTFICGAIIWFAICLPHVRAMMQKIKRRRKENTR